MTSVSNRTTTASLLPPKARELLPVEETASCHGTAAVAPHGSGYSVTSDYGWPSVYYDSRAQGVWCYKNEDLYLNYDFEVVSGKGCVPVYFDGDGDVNTLDVVAIFNKIAGLA